MSCKNKVFKKLLLFSFVFLVFSLFCNKVILADMTKQKNTTPKHSEHVKTQQKQIISSLKKIEDCLDKQEVKN